MSLEASGLIKASARMPHPRPTAWGSSAEGGCRLPTELTGSSVTAPSGVPGRVYPRGHPMSATFVARLAILLLDIRLLKPRLSQRGLRPWREARRSVHGMLVVLNMRTSIVPNFPPSSVGPLLSV